MAFRFKTRSTVTTSTNKQPEQTATNIGPNIDSNTLAPKLTNAQLNQLAKLYPSWLKDNTALKQLPGVYQGVLGQVQLQPDIGEFEKKLLVKQEKPTDYMIKFTDTNRVHQLLSASQLPNETLATIWAHVNKTFPGKLTNKEVCLALALIAIFQRLDKEASIGGNHFSPSSKDKDPFQLVRLEKKPPVPTLYSPGSYHNNSKNNNNTYGGSIKGIVQSKSTPENLSSSKGLLVDITSSTDDDDESSKEAPNELCKNKTSHDYCSGANGSDLNSRVKDIILNNPMSLMDSDSDRFEIDFNKTTKMWSEFLLLMKGIFKRSFDILNVENSRQSAIEALKSPRGIDFGRNLSLCYPLAHNIKGKFDQLNNIETIIDEQSNSKSSIGGGGLFDKKYASQIDDLMTSINEYWAVLINLLHEAGQTQFIELIMDGLIQYKSDSTSSSIEDIAMEFSPRSDICLICHSKFYLDPSYDYTSRQLASEVLNSIETEELISEDGQHYYHPRCVSFWLNQVDATGLPFLSEYIDQTILSPDLLD